MREIKFRIWDKEQKKMLKPQWEDDDDRGIEGKARIHINAEGKIYFTLTGYVDDDGWPYEVDCDIMQYTGLKDMNGTEIYEGDIVRFGKEIGFIGELQHGCYTFNRKETYWKCEPLPLFSMSFRYVEVIGNIDENPELLEGRE